MKIIFIVALLALVGSNAQAQKPKKQKSDIFTDVTQWFQGSVMLPGGEERKGLLRYNDRIEALSFDDGSGEETFKPSQVLAFEFSDETNHHQRLFYSLDYEDSETNIAGTFYFEVLKKYESFSVLSRADRIDMNEKSSFEHVHTFNGAQKVYATKTVFSQTETIFLMTSSGEIKPYFKVMKSDDGKNNLFNGKDTETHNQMIDRNLLSEFVSPAHLEKLTAFAKAENLKFKRKTDLLKILLYYDSLLQE